MACTSNRYFLSRDLLHVYMFPFVHFYKNNKRFNDNYIHIPSSFLKTGIMRDLLIKNGFIDAGLVLNRKGLDYLISCRKNNPKQLPLFPVNLYC